MTRFGTIKLGPTDEMFVAESGEAIVFAYPNTVLVSDDGVIFLRTQARCLADFRLADPPKVSAVFNDPLTDEYVHVHRVGDEASVSGVIHTKTNTPSEVKVDDLPREWSTFRIFRTPDGKYIVVRKMPHGNPHSDLSWELFVGDQLALHREKIRQVIPLADGSVRIYALRGELLMPGVLASGKVPTWNGEAVAVVDPNHLEFKGMGEIAALVHPGLPAPLHS